MSNFSKSLSQTWLKEDKLRSTEELLTKHLGDNFFVDYFNVFLNLPVFGQRVLFKLHERRFIFDPPVFEAVNHDRVVAWIAARRFHLFTKTHLFLEYQLCHKLRNIDFELRFKDLDYDGQTHHTLKVFANNLLGSVAGMYLFREHLRASSGENVFGCWLHVQRFRQTRVLVKRREIFNEIQQRYLHAKAVDKLSNTLCRVVTLDLLSFPVVPDSETELSAQLMTDHYVPSCEVDLSSSEALAQVHRVLLQALRSYWAPCYVMHVLSTQPFSTLEELFRVPKGSVIQNLTDLKMLIRRCTLFKVSGDLDSTPKHDALSGKDEQSLPTISTSSSILSPASSSTRITSNPQESTFTYLPYLQSLTEASRISALEMGRGHLSTRDQLHPEDTGFIVPKLPSIEITQGQASQSRGDTSDEDLTEVCVVEQLLDIERYCDYPAKESRRHDCKKEVKKASDEMEEDDDSKVRLVASIMNLTRLALKEMALKPEPMLYLNQLLRHYIFGYRHLDQEKPVTDRRTLCLLACDDLAGSPFRSYLAGQDQQLHFSYFDFWSAMRRYQQLYDLNRMGDIMHTKNCTMIADLRRQHIRYMMKRFLMGSGVGANILNYKIRLSLLEDIRKARWSPLINSALDVVSNVLSIPMTQFILYDRQDFRKHAMDSSSPLSNLEQDSQAEDIMASLDTHSILLSTLRRRYNNSKMLSTWSTGQQPVPRKLQPCSKASFSLPVAQGLTMKIPSVLHSLLKRRSEAASLQTFADRRCLSDPWREDPKHDPEGDMECLRPTDPRGTKYDGVVGVLGEQHRLLAFQFLIVLREDLPDAQVCGVTSLARIVRSDYGSLHIPFSAPVNHRFLASLRPKQRISRATLLKPSPFIEVEVFPFPVIKRLGPMETLTMNDLLETRRNRSKLELKRPQTPRTFLDILEDEMQFNYFKKYLEVKGQLKAVTFVEDVQDTLRLKVKAEKEIIVAGIIEQFLGDGERILTFGEEMPMTVRIGESPDLENLRSAQLALEEQIEKTWQNMIKALALDKIHQIVHKKYLLSETAGFLNNKDVDKYQRFKKYVEELQLHKVDLPPLDQETNKEDWLENYLLVQKKTRRQTEEKEKMKKKLMIIKREKERRKVEKDKRQKHTKSMVVDKGGQSRETTTDFERKEESKESRKKTKKKDGKEKNDRKEGKEKKDRKEGEEKTEKKEEKEEKEKIGFKKTTKSKEGSDTLGDVKEGKYKGKGESSRERKKKPQAEKGKNKMERQGEKYDSAEERSLPSRGVKRKRKRKNDDQKAGDQVNEDKIVIETDEQEFKDQEEEDEIKSVSGTESEEEQDQDKEASKSGEETLDKNKQISEEYQQEIIQRKESGEDNKGTSPRTASLNQMTSKRQAEISKKEEKKRKKTKEENKKDLKKRDLTKKKSMEDEEDRLKDSEKEKEEEKADILLRSEKVADEKNLARIKSQTLTDAQGHKATSQILQPRKYSSQAATKEEIHKDKEEKRAYQAETEFLQPLEYFKNMEHSAEVMPESTESPIVMYNRANELSITLTEKTKPLGLWRHVVKKMVKFTRSLNIPLERKLFEIYLKQELQNAKNNLTPDKVFKTTDSEGIEHVVYTRKILKDLLIQVNKLPADLRFWVEADRFKKQMIYYLNCSENIGIPIEKEFPILGMRAEAIVECFFHSVCEPVVQVNLCTDKIASQIIKSKSTGLSVDLFHDIYIRLYPMLFNMWKIFAKRWLSRLRVNQRKENIEMLLASFKDPIIGDFPHPHEPSADYLHLKLSDCKHSRGTDREVREVTGSMLRFSIHHGIRLVNEAEQRLTKLPEIKVNSNNSCKVSVAKHVKNDKKRDSVFCETQYQEPGKIDRSNNCPGNSDTVGSRVKLPVLVKALECRERKGDFGIEKSKVQNTDEEKNDETSAQEDQTSTHRSDKRETENNQKPKFREGDKQMDNDSSQKFTRRTDRDTKTLQTEMRQHGKQEHKMQEANRAFICVSGQLKELQLLNPVFLSRSLPPLDGCLQLQDNQSVWGPGKRAFKGDCAEQGSVDVAESIYVVVKERHYCDQWKRLHKDLLSVRDWTTTSNAGREF